MNGKSGKELDSEIERLAKEKDEEKNIADKDDTSQQKNQIYPYTMAAAALVFLGVMSVAYYLLTSKTEPVPK